MPAASRAQASGLALAALGWIAIAFWLSMAVFPQVIPPLSRWPDWAGFLPLGEMPAWIRQQAGLDKPEGEIIAALNRELLAAYVFQWLLILAGVTSGVLLVRRRRAGWWMALAMCGGLLAMLLAKEVSMLVSFGRRYPEAWAILAKYAPSVLARGVINVLFCVVAILVLTCARRGCRSLDKNRVVAQN